MAGRYLPARLKVYLTSLQRLCDLRLIKCSGFFSFFKGSSTWPHVRLQWFISGGRKKTCWSGYFPHMMKAIFMFFFVLILAPFCWVFCLYKNNYLKPHILPNDVSILSLNWKKIHLSIPLPVPLLRNWLIQTWLKSTLSDVTGVTDTSITLTG